MAAADSKILMANVNVVVVGKYKGSQKVPRVKARAISHRFFEIDNPMFLGRHHCVAQLMAYKPRI
jgi:hypothetical protein